VTMTIEEIQDSLTAILDGAEGRDLTDEEVATFEGLEKDLGEAQAKRERSEKLRARNAELKAAVTKPLFTEAKPERDTLEAAFTAYLRTGRENADIQELRAAQSEGVPSEGGFLVPDGIRQKIVERMVEFGGLANVVDEITTETGNNLSWLNETDDTANRGEIVAEGGTFAGGADLAFSKSSLGAYSYMAGGAGGLPLRISRELVQDSAFDIVGRVSRKLGERMARLQAEHIVRGTGVGEPQGIVTGRTGVGMYSGASDALVYADFLTVVHALDPAYRQNARWSFNDTFLRAVRGLVDANGRPLLETANDGIDSARGGATLLGFPVTIDQAFSNPTATSATVNFGVFGDLREAYIVRRVRAIELLVNPYSRMSNRQIEYSAYARMDAVQQNVNAYTALTGTA
jgi:HK97 family phage major capsid protein